MSTRCQIEWIGEGNKLLTCGPIFCVEDGEDGTGWEAGVPKALIKAFLKLIRGR